MTCEYKRTLSGSSLVLFGDSLKETKDYRIEVLKNNVVPGILPLTTGTEDGVFKLYYEVTGHQPISTIYSKKKLDHRALAAFIKGIVRALEGTGEYLLEPEGIVFEPEYIFLNGDMECSFVYFPDREAGVAGALHAFGEYLIGHVDHGDSRAVKLAYGFFETTGKDELLLDDLRKLMVSEAPAPAPAPMPVTAPAPRPAPVPMPAPTPAPTPVREGAAREDSFPQPVKKKDGKPSRRDKVKKEKKKAPKEKPPGRKSVLDYIIWLGAAGVIIWLIYDNVLRKMGTGGLVITGIISLLALALIVGMIISGRSKDKKKLNIEDKEEKEEVKTYSYRESLAGRDVGEEACYTGRSLEGVRPKKQYDGDYGETGLLREHPGLDLDEYEKTGLLTETRSRTPGLVPVRDSGMGPLLISHFPFVVGKSLSYADGKIEDPFISRVHCRFHKGEDDSYTLEDLGSRNGSELNGTLLTPNTPYLIHEGDEVKLGRSLFRFEMV